MMKEVRILVTEYTRVFDKLEALGINVNGMIRQARGYWNVRTPRIRQV